MTTFRLITTTCLVATAILAQAQNLLRNPSFEDAPEGNPGQGLMPNEWFAVAGSPDTYSNDGSFGLPPEAFGNFPGVLAEDGKRWVAGANFPESFAQNLSVPLGAGGTYTLSGWMHQALRPDLDNPGAYLVSLRSADQTLIRPVGTLGFTSSSAEGWTLQSFTFQAPNDAALLTMIRFDPIVPDGQSFLTYPGLDNLSLTPAPEPATLVALAAGLAIVRRRRTSS